MPPLPSNLRRDLERAIIKARDVAEAGARAALEALTIHEGKVGGHLTGDQRTLRNRLRAHARQLGDNRNSRSGAQAIDRLMRECAYEHWHRMIFARFLAENDLLVEPESGVSVTLDEVEELARDAKADPWDLASRYAQRMLPQIFRPDDPLLAVALPTETRVELESLLESLPTETFGGDDSLGWVYQFWQSKRKDEVNDSGEKITGDTLPAVTQLFTEHYMVLFLLHNTMGAWHAGRVLAQRPKLAKTAGSEQELRNAVALSQADGYSFEYLRFVRDPVEGDADNAPTGPWRPAAGTFDGWPKEAIDLKVLDPCCGSGHFLVAVFELLTRLRMDEEGLSVEEASRAVLRDNVFGLEVDQRCTQIAAFALAFAVWKMTGRVIDLPSLNIACCGIGPSATLDEWLTLAEQAEHTLPAHAREPVCNGLENLHRLFSQASELGSLIDPSELPSDMFAADYETLQPFLEEVFQRESADAEARELAVAAQGMVRASELLAGEYHLVITNVPYLARGKQDELIQRFCEANFRKAKTDLATVFLLRMFGLLDSEGVCAIVITQNWRFQPTYSSLRKSVLSSKTLNFVGALGPRAFETITGEVVNVGLFVHSAVRPTEPHAISFIEASAEPNSTEKMRALRERPVSRVSQRSQRDNPDHVISLHSSDGEELLGNRASSYQGIKTGDDGRYKRKFWEVAGPEPGWRLMQSTVEESCEYGGLVPCQHLILGFRL